MCFRAHISPTPNLTAHTYLTVQFRTIMEDMRFDVYMEATAEAATASAAARHAEALLKPAWFCLQTDS